MPISEHASDSPQELVPTSAVASLCEVDVATVNRWARSGRLRPAAKAPGRNGANLFLRADVDALLAAEAAS